MEIEFKVNITEEDIRNLLAEHLSAQYDGINIDPGKIKFFVRTSAGQPEWRIAEIKAKYEAP